MAKTVEKLTVPTFAEAAHIVTLHRADWMSSLERYVSPHLGSMPISEIKCKDVIDVLSPIAFHKPVTARRVRQRISLIMRWAIAHEYRKDDPAGEAINGIIRVTRPVTPSRAAHHEQLASVISGVHASGAPRGVTLAFEFLVLTVARPGEVRLAQWGEIDLETATWTKRVMHGRSGPWHCVPLSSRSVDVLREVLALNGGKAQGSIFVGNTGRAIDPSAMSNLLRRVCAPCVPQGVRTSFRVWCGETAVPWEVSEACLSHKVGTAMGRAFARSFFLEQSRLVMEAWAEYLAQTASPSIPTPPRPVRRTQGRIPDSKRNRPRASRTSRTNKTDPQQGN